MNRELARLVLLEESKRDKRVPYDRLSDKKYPEQNSFVTDPARFVVAICTRRAGKSHGLAMRLFRAGFKHARSLSIYIALTRDSAERIMWPAITEINARYNLGANLVESKLKVELPNGSQLILVGADTKNFIERLRGPKYAEAQIDEAQSFRQHISVLTRDILGPALGDYRGALVLTGTPGPIPSGLFYDACESSKIKASRHRWSIYQNPYFPDPRGFVQEEMEKNGWTTENPTYRREYLGEWIRDDGALVYKFNPERNTYDDLPEGLRWSHILAVDYGWNDQTAFSVVCFSKSSPHVFIRHVEGHSEMVPGDIARRIQELTDEFKPVSIIADTGGLGKSITEEFIRRYHIAITPADKREKLTFINLLNGDFIDGRCFVHRSLTGLQDQYLSLQKAENPTASRFEDPTMPNDLCDATLYAYRKAKHYLGQTPKTFSSEEERWKAFEKELERKEIEVFEQQNDKEWWEK